MINVKTKIQKYPLKSSEGNFFNFGKYTNGL